jgi:hypothetical protein
MQFSNKIREPNPADDILIISHYWPVGTAVASFLISTQNISSDDDFLAHSHSVCLSMMAFRVIL